MKRMTYVRKFRIQLFIPLHRQDKRHQKYTDNTSTFKYYD